MEGSWFHFDPLNLLVVIGGIIAFWLKSVRRETMTLQTVKQLSSWAEKHEHECDLQRQIYAKMLTELVAGNAHLSAIVDGHQDRLTRVENRLDRE